MPPSLDDLQLQPKPAIIGLARPCVARGTGSSQSADISERGPKRNLGTKPYRAEPEVRIHLPPAKSRANFRSLSGGARRNDGTHLGLSSANFGDERPRGPYLRG
jgi:hypothetical protein